jgi:glycosyltransferase involved in cell wall biosynthesis
MISILLATYNGEKYIKESIDSILNQTFKDFELLIGFNGTIDGSKQIVSEYNDSRIKIFDYNDDKGKAKTLNKLLKESCYDWVAIQDDDDVWIENKLEEQVKYIRHFDIIGTFINYIDGTGTITGSPSLMSGHEAIVGLSLKGDNQIANSSVLIRKSICLSVGGWREDLDKLIDSGYQPLEDYDLWLRLFKINGKFINIPEYLVKHRIHKDSNFNNKRFDISKIIN